MVKMGIIDLEDPAEETLEEFLLECVGNFVRLYITAVTRRV